MGRLRVCYFGYREWSLRLCSDLIRENVAEISLFSHRSQTNVIPMIQPDIVLFYGWSWIVPIEIVNNYVCLCLHPSSLPKYRGGSPIQNQIMDGVTESAVSIFRMTKEIDAGPIYISHPISLAGNVSDIYNRIYSVGLKCTIDLIKNFDRLQPVPQNEQEATFCIRRTPDESEITVRDFCDKSAKSLHDKIRMLTDPYPNAFVVCGDGKKLFLTGSYV